MPSKVSGPSVGIQADRDIKLLHDMWAHVKTKLKGDMLSKESKASVLKF